MVQVRVVGVAFDQREQPLILLAPTGDAAAAGGLVLPIWIGEQEATSILVAVEGAEAPRPLAHDLMRAMLDALGARVERVEVTSLDEGTFYAEVTLLGPTGRQVLDCRPSDAVALAARTHAPIHVADAVLAEGGIPADAVQVPDDSAADDAAQVDEFKRFLDEVDPEDFQG